MFILKKYKYDTKVLKHKWKINNVKVCIYIYFKNQTNALKEINPLNEKKSNQSGKKTHA